jgi:MYXO-CTERM domain-containing protein
VRPYTWRVAAGSLPTGLALTSEGLISGAPRGTPNGTTRFTAEVRDASGGRSQREFAVRLVAPGSIVIGKVRLPDGLVGGDYLEDIAVSNADGSALAKPLTWRITGALPDGLSLSEQTEIATIMGKPAQAGLFPFTLSVEDANGRTDAMDYMLTIHPGRYKVIASLPEVLRPMQSDLNVQFVVAPANQVKFAVVAGALPTGLTLTPAGVLSGTVADDAEGQWNFVVEARDSSGMSGLAPFSTRVEREVKTTGCGATDGASPLALVAVALLLARRRFRVALPRGLGALALAVALLPGAALAQQYQVVGPSQIVFQPLGAAGQPVGQAITAGSTVTLPFDVPFYSARVTALGFSQYGYLAVGGSIATDSSNETVPHNVNSTLSARAFIAPWWDTLGAATAFKYAVTGTAPARVAIIEWTQVPSASGAATRLTFQARLYETTGRIQFLYDGVVPASGSGSVGLQGDLNNGVPGLTCSTTASCGTGDYPSSRSLDFFLPPDLEISSLSVPQTGYAGVSFPVTANVLNSGGRQAANVDVTFYLSTDALLDASDVVLGTASALAIEAGTTAQVTSTASLPSTLTGTNYFIIASADVSNAIVERNELNNTSTGVSTTIGAPTPDLVATAFSAPSTAQPGAMLQVSRSIKNAGNATATDFKYSYFLSDNSVVTVSDRALSPVGTVASLAAAATDTAMDTVALPAALPPGNYWLGFCANYDTGTSRFGGNEITIVNDCITSLTPVQVSTTDVSVVTTTLPAATQYSPYGLRLQALGGSGQYTWEVASGSTLPGGVTLSAQGDLGGAPSKTGTFAFDVKVTSGAATATKSLSLMVGAGTLPLVVVDQVLSAAEFGRAYIVPLVAVGGKPPYTWALKMNTLPAGLAIATDGLIEGRAAESGDFMFPVEVTDSAGAKASKELAIKVVTPSTLTVATRALPEGTLNREYLQPLVAVGGKAPYAWSVEAVQQLAENSTEAPGSVLKDPAQITQFMLGLGLGVDDGTTQDFLRGVPKKAGLFVITFKVTDGAATEDRTTVLFHVGYVDGLAITTTMLPDAFFNELYGPVLLSHNGGRDAEGVKYSLPCIKQAIHAGTETTPPEFACAAVDATQQLPPGIIMGDDGSISGTPSGGLGTYTFLVKLQDAAGRQDLRALSIRVRADYKTQSSGGCTGSPGAPSLFALLGVLGLALRRRRS